MKKDTSRNNPLAQTYQRFWRSQEHLARLRSDYYLITARNVRLQERWFRMLANFWEL